MLRILAVSDSHGGCYTLARVLEKHSEARYILHLGDGASDMEELLPTCRATVYQVAGNCDFRTDLPTEQEVRIGNTPILFAHGHTYGVKHGLGKLETEARRRGVALALFGHTHEPLCRYEDGLYLVNPGSLRFGGSYALIDVADNGIAVNIAHVY